MYSWCTLHTFIYVCYTTVVFNTRLKEGDLLPTSFEVILAFTPRGGLLPSKRLSGMCRWMGSHFHNRTDYNGVTFLVELLEWGPKFSGYLG